MKNLCLSIFLLCLFTSNSSYAGAKLKIKAKVLSYSDKRVKLKIGSQVKYLYFEKLTQREVDSLSKYLDKEKYFYVSKSDLKDKEL